jgi:hypothetical protein
MHIFKVFTPDILNKYMQNFLQKIFAEKSTVKVILIFPKIKFIIKVTLLCEHFANTSQASSFSFQS